MMFLFCMPTRVIFGNKTIDKLSEEYSLLGPKILLVCGSTSIKNSGLLERVRKHISKSELIVFDRISSDPDLNLIEEAVLLARAHRISGVLAIGGGSSIDAAKLIACAVTNPEIDIVNYTNQGSIVSAFWRGDNLGLPVIAVPTTSGSGSEVTKASVISDKKFKVKCSIKSLDFFPEVAIVDPELTYTLSEYQTAATALDALVHGIESYLSKSASPFTDILALESIKCIYDNLLRVLANPADSSGRELIAYGSLLGGITETNAGLGIVHALAHPIGANFAVSHGVACALTLVASLKFNFQVQNAKLATIGKLFGKEDADYAILRIEELLKVLPIPKRLSEVNIAKKDIDNLASEGFRNNSTLGFNPREVLSSDELVKVLLDSY